MLYDHVADKDRDGQIRLLADKLRELGKDVGEDARVKGKGKGREIVIRYEGETIEGEHPAVLRDPRKESKVRRKETMRPVRADLVPVKYEVREYALSGYYTSAHCCGSMMQIQRARRFPLPSWCSTSRHSHPTRTSAGASPSMARSRRLSLRSIRRRALLSESCSSSTALTKKRANASRRSMGRSSRL